MLALLPGCVTRKLFIHSNPSGARVLLDGKVVGTTPYEEEFISYGVRRVVLEHPGRVPLNDTIDVARPWWQAFPIDVFTDLVWPFSIEDERRFEFELAETTGSKATRADAEATYRLMRAVVDELRGIAPITPQAPPDEEAAQEDVLEEAEAAAGSAADTSR